MSLPTAITQDEVDRITDRWQWTIGGVVDNNPDVVVYIILDYLGYRIPDYWEEQATHHTAQEAIYRQRRKANRQLAEGTNY